MVNKARARTGADKLARRMEILEGALELWDKTSYAELTMSQVADKLNLAKGTLYLYFPSKEELFLAIYIQLLNEWFDQAEIQLEDLVNPSPASLAKSFVNLLTERPKLARLIPLAAYGLERNVTLEAGRDYKGWLVGRFDRIADQLEEVVPGLPPGTGFEAISSFLILAAGLGPIADPAPALRELESDPALAKLGFQFGPTLEQMFTTFVVGLQHRFR